MAVASAAGSGRPYCAATIANRAVYSHAKARFRGSHSPGPLSDLDMLAGPSATTRLSASSFANATRVPSGHVFAPRSHANAKGMTWSTWTVVACFFVQWIVLPVYGSARSPEVTTQ